MIIYRIIIEIVYCHVFCRSTNISRNGETLRFHRFDLGLIRIDIELLDIDRLYHRTITLSETVIEIGNCCVIESIIPELQNNSIAQIRNKLTINRNNTKRIGLDLGTNLNVNLIICEDAIDSTDKVFQFSLRIKHLFLRNRDNSIHCLCSIIRVIDKRENRIFDGTLIHNNAIGFRKN